MLKTNRLVLIQLLRCKHANSYTQVLQYCHTLYRTSVRMFHPWETLLLLWAILLLKCFCSFFLSPTKVARPASSKWNKGWPHHRSSRSFKQPLTGCSLQKAAKAQLVIAAIASANLQPCTSCQLSKPISNKVYYTNRYHEHAVRYCTKKKKEIP